MRLIKTQTPVDFTLQTAGRSPAGLSLPGNGDGIMRWFLPNFKYSISPTEQGAAPSLRSLQVSCSDSLPFGPHPALSVVCVLTRPPMPGGSEPFGPLHRSPGQSGGSPQNQVPTERRAGTSRCPPRKPDRGRADSRSGPTTLSFRCCAPWRQLSRRSCPQTSALLPLFSVS